MSGIVGIVHHNQKPIEQALLTNMTARMATRGPDAQSIWHDRRVGLGHTLLRTTFESAHEQQPSSLDGQIWIAADARIDDRHTLMRTLRSHGEIIEQTITDDKLILSAYKIWGSACLDHLIGDFSFALWDAHQQQLFCATDQFGVVPFYYARVSDGLVVSNTLNCLRLHPDISDRLDEQAIGDYLLFRMNHNPSGTTFREIRRLPASHSMIYSAGHLQVQQYWSVPDSKKVTRYDEQEYVEQFRTLFDNAVSDRLRTDSVASHLSGGLDSTSITAVAHEQLLSSDSSFAFQAFTKVFEQLIPHEEEDYAQQVATRLGIPLNRVVAENFAWEVDLESPSYIPPEPCFMRRKISRNHIFESASGFARVLLAGFGGDPLLAYLPSADWRNPVFFGHWRSLLVNIRGEFHAHGRTPSSFLATFLAGHGGKSNDGTSPILPPWLNSEFNTQNGLKERYAQVSQRIRKGYYYQRGMVNDPLWQRVFTWHDPAFTMTPLKVRFPFFDVRLLKFVLHIPPLPWLHKKHLLRLAMQGTLPDTILERPKTPLARNAFRVRMLQSGAPEWMKEIATTVELTPYVDSRTLLRMVQSPADHPDSQYKQVMRPLSLGYWLRRQRDGVAGPQNSVRSKIIQQRWEQAGDRVIGEPLTFVQ